MKSKQQQVSAHHHSRLHAAPEQQQQYHHSLPAPPAAVSANCIDLTIDDDSEDDDEPLVPVGRPQAQRSPQRNGDAISAAVASSSVSRVESVHGNDGNGSSNGQNFGGEPVESDVDEEWPQSAPVAQLISMPARASMRQLSLSFSDNEDPESEEDEELPKRKIGSPAKRATGAQLTSEASAIDSAQVEGRNDTSVTNADKAEDGITSAIPTNSDASHEALDEAKATDEPAATKRNDIDDDEYLEDGEIFEEGAVPASPTKVKQAIALERLASRALGDSDTASPLQQQRQKKQKKRGKKKSKRKLEAMLMMGGGAGATTMGGSEFEFERNTRHQPFLPPTAALDQHMAEVDNMMMMYRGPPSHPGNAHAAPTGFGAPPMPPPPHLHIQGTNLPMPSGPSPQPPPSSGSFPAFADDQILRVNRHGSVEMFNSNVEFPRNGPKPPPLPPQPPVAFGGFKYRRIPPQPPRAPAPLVESSGSNSTGGSSSSSTGESPEKLRNEGGAKAKPDFDLDSLRAAALRTKRLSKVVAEPDVSAADVAAVATTKGSPLPSLPPVQAPVSSAPALPKKNDDSEPSIDDLRAEILRSMMMKKKKAARPATGNTTATLQSHPPVKLATAPAKVSSPVSVDQQQQQEQQVVDRTQSKVVMPEVSQKETQPPLPTVQEKPAASEKPSALKPSPSPSPPLPPRVDYNSLSVSTVVTPKFRPLTASSQSIVICLSPEDYAKSSKSGDNGSGGGASGNSSSSSTIQSAIDEMRKKIAEKEKLRKESRSGGASEVSQKSAAAKNGDAVVAEKIVQDQQQQENGQQTVHADNVGNLETAKKTKNPETMSSLQARIEAMKKQIAAKEMEKSNGASSTSSSTRASASSSPLNSVKKPAVDTPPTTNGVSTACVPTSTSTTKANGAPAAADDHRSQQNAPCIRKSKDAALAVPYVST